MSKKLLNEAQIRRFQSLANLPVVNEMVYAKKDETDERTEKQKMADQEHRDDLIGDRNMPVKKEGAHMDEEKHEMKEDVHEDEAEQEMGPEPMEPEMDMDAPSGDLDLSEEEARAIIDLGKKLEAIMVADEPMDDMETSAELAGAEDAVDMPGDMLEGVSVEPSRNEVVEEVARRVARRLNEAKRAQRRLNRALGNK